MGGRGSLLLWRWRLVRLRNGLDSIVPKRRMNHPLSKLPPPISLIDPCIAIQSRDDLIALRPILHFCKSIYHVVPFLYIYLHTLFSLCSRSNRFAMARNEMFSIQISPISKLIHPPLFFASPCPVVLAPLLLHTRVARVEKIHLPCQIFP